MCACLGVSLPVARAALLAAGPAASRLNRPIADEPQPAPAPTSPGRGDGGGEEVGVGVGGQWVELRSVMLAGGPVAGLPQEALRGLATLYDEPYSHETDAAFLRSLAATAGYTHVVVAAGRSGDAGPLKVAAVGALEAALESTEGNETLVSHGTHWYCRTDRGFGFAPNDDIQKKGGCADGSHMDDPLRLSWQLNKCGGFRAGDVCQIYYGNEWRKLVWGFRL